MSWFVLDKRGTQTGKSGKVSEFQSGRGKARENGKSQEK